MTPDTNTIRFFPDYPHSVLELKTDIVPSIATGLMWMFEATLRTFCIRNTVCLSYLIQNERLYLRIEGSLSQTERTETYEIGNRNIDFERRREEDQAVFLKAIRVILGSDRTFIQGEIGTFPENREKWFFEQFCTPKGFHLTDGLRPIRKLNTLESFSTPAIDSSDSDQVSRNLLVDFPGKDD
ncbi:MAG: hypothetical protein HGB18_04800 [Candidatus Moranbacteria bacterium]|nr:hypothetical protein [Candidatus Moranbacteria bacterium]